MTNPIVNFSSNQTLSNPLVSQSDAQALIDASLVTGGIPTFSNSTSYVTGNIVYYLGIYYIAPSNIASGGGTPLANTTWRQIPTWGSYTTTATAAGTTTLDLYSAEIQRFTGATTQTIVMPVASTLPALGKPFYIINDSTGILTVNSSGGNLITTIDANQRCKITNLLLSGTTAASWAYDLSGTMPTSGTTLTLSSYLNEAKGADIASATTTDIGAATGNYVDVTGTTTITGLGTIQAGTRRIVRFTGALTLTHNATSLILPNAVNITTVASDVACFISLGSGNWRCVWYTRSTWTGSGSDVKATSPTLVTPVLGVATVTSINKVTITAPATSATLTLADGKTITFNKTLTFDGTDSTTMTFPSTSASIARIDAAQAFTGTQTFNNYIQLSENGGVLSDQALSADGKFCIESGFIGTLGETVLFGQLCYLKAADSKWWLADSDVKAQSGNVRLAFCCVAGVANDQVQMMKKGKIRADSLFPTLTVGAPVHVSSTAGSIVVNAPIVGISRIVGHANTTDELEVDISDEYEEMNTLSPTDGSGASLSLTINSAKEIRKGRFISTNIDITYPATASGANAQINGCCTYSPNTLTPAVVNPHYTGGALGSDIEAYYDNGNTYIQVYDNTVQLTNANLTGHRVYFAANFITSSNL